MIGKTIWQPLIQTYAVEIHRAGITVQATQAKGSDSVMYAFRRDGETGWFGYAVAHDVTLEEFAARFTTEEATK